MPPVRARCPLCRRQILTFTHYGRPIFEHHTADGVRGGSNNPDQFNEPCTGSGWLVEDEDRVA